MPHPQAEDDWDDDFDSDDEDDNEGDLSDDDEDEPTVSCPKCHKQIHEDAQRCPFCENYLSEEDAPAHPKPWWIVVGALLCLFAVLKWIAG